MKNVRLILSGTSTGATLITVIVGLTLGPIWAIVAGTFCVLATMVLSTYILIKSNQTVLQRLSGGQKQQQRMLQSLWLVQKKVEAQRLALTHQNAQVNSLLNAFSAQDENTSDKTELREQLDQIVQLLKVQQSQKNEPQITDLKEQLEEMFGSDPEVEILTTASVGQRQ